MSKLILLAVSLLLGIGLRRIKALAPDAHLSLNQLILHVPLPAVSLLTIPLLRWKLDLLALCLVSWLIFMLAYFLFNFLGARYQWDRRLIGCLILTAGLGNTSFVGFPVIEALFGTEALRYAVLVDKPGTFLIAATLGIWIASLYSTGRMRKRDLVRKVVLFPPFVAFVSATLLGLAGWRAEGEVKTLLESLAAILTPLAMISVGLQLRWRDIGAEYKFLSIGLGFKLVLAPLVIYFLYQAIGIQAKIFQVALMEAAMGPMITASIIAASHNLHPRLAGMMVGVGIPLSFVTLTIWYFLL